MRQRSLVIVATFLLAASAGLPAGLRSPSSDDARRSASDAGSAKAAAISDPVRTDAGQLAGVTLLSGVRVFKGIPFGAPPIGELRWRAPQPVAKWSGVRKADTFGNVCMQPKGVGRLNVSVDLPDSPPAGEDCLYLNVWTAAEKTSERRPVMMWIFGGAYTEGAGSSPHNDGEALARKGVVYVSLNYRLGPFGFFSHPELTKESGSNASGNQAMSDNIAALRWIQRNIAAFGGDPRNVTIFGESAGAALVAGLTGSPDANGLFHRAISESGAWMGLGMAPMRSRTSAEQPDPRCGVPFGQTPPASAPPLPPLAELRARSAAEVAKTVCGAGMIVDGAIVSEDLSITFAQRRQNAVDVLVGANKDEGSFARPSNAQEWTNRVRARWGDLAEEYLKQYPASIDAEAAASAEAAFADEMFWHMRLFADAQAKLGKQAWLYYFTHEPPSDPSKRNLRATHTAEIPYVFNNLRAPRVFPDTSSPELTSVSPRDLELAGIVSSYWVNFARKGDPNGTGLAKWPTFRDAGVAMILGSPAPVPAPAKLALYDALYARQMASVKVRSSQ